MTVRVVLGEDSQVMRESVLSLLRHIAGVRVIAACADATVLRTTIDETLPDVVLTDIRMPPTNTDEGLRIADDLRTSYPDIGVVVLSQHPDAIYVAALFARGSDGRAYLLKDWLGDRRQLSRAILTVAHGGSVVDTHVVELLIAARAQAPGAKLSELTPRERDVLALVAAGHSNAAIGEELAITKRAVEQHVNAVFSKLDLGDERDVSRRVEAVIMYLHAGDG